MNADALLLAVLATVLASGCRNGRQKPVPPDPGPPPTNRIAVPEAVRRNLGIQFATVERRRVAATLRVPGSFELLPQARREYRTPLPGRVELVAHALQQVAAGDLLYRLDSPQWRSLQREIAELVTTAAVARSKIEYLGPLLEAHRAHEASLQDAARVMAERVQRIEATSAEVGGQAPELSAAQVQLAQVRADQAEAGEKRAETEATLAELRVNLAAAEDRFQLALAAAAPLLDLDRDRLAAPLAKDGRPTWQAIQVIDVRAVATGTVDALPVASGGWVEVGDLVATAVDVKQVRFRARGLQSDLSRLAPGLVAAVVAPQDGAALGQRLPGKLLLGVEADPRQRTVDLFLQPDAAPEWARPGVAAYLEIETQSGASAELAVPLSAVLHDGLQRVLFRRDPKDPDQVIRVEADLGIDDGRWVEVKSGLRDGDEVVLAGAYELMLASSGTAAKGGHFHADGTFHAEAKK